MTRRRRDEIFLTGALVVSIIGLFAQLAWPGILRFYHRPRPGRQSVVQLTASGASGHINYEALLYLPSEYVGHRDWPLIVWLHGSGERGRDLHDLCRYGLPKFLAHGQQLPAVVVSPQCLPDIPWSHTAILATIDELQLRYDIDRRRIYIVGYSMGAFGSWKVLASAPGRLAAIVSVAGGGVPIEVPRPTGCQIWAIHGSEDTVVPLRSTDETVMAYRANGWNIRYSVLDGVGHDLRNYVSPDSEVMHWLLKQSLAEE